MSKNDSLKIGLSPCPNDTYIFHALLHGIIKLPQISALDPFIADVEQLNKLALKAELPVTKISIGVMPYILNNYCLLSSGAALGWNCGPLVVCKKKMTPEELANAEIAIPGFKTTANLLLDLHGGFKGPRREMIFNEIMPAVAKGAVDAGIIIHEGRFTYHLYNLYKVMDMGEWWEESFNMPLPLGGIAIRRDMHHELAKSIEQGIAQSVLYANKNPEDSRAFIKAHAQELDNKVIYDHIKTFVTDYSIDLGETGKNAICKITGASTQFNNLEPEKSLFL